MCARSRRCTWHRKSGSRSGEVIAPGATGPRGATEVLPAAALPQPACGHCCRHRGGTPTRAQARLATPSGRAWRNTGARPCTTRAAAAAWRCWARLPAPGPAPRGRRLPPGAAGPGCAAAAQRPTPAAAPHRRQGTHRGTAPARAPATARRPAPAALRVSARPSATAAAGPGSRPAPAPRCAAPRSRPALRPPAGTRRSSGRLPRPAPHAHSAACPAGIRRPR